ncbi:MAG: M24 family metallopeptidase [Polyangiales bacterium]
MASEAKGESAERVARVREAMRAAGVDAMIVRGTDRYINEYVPEDESTRVWLTGFSGSTGDALVGLDGAWLFVDGRYHVQADREVDTALWTVVKNALGVANETATARRLTEMAAELPEGKSLRVGYEADRYSLNGFESFSKQLRGAAVELVPLSPSPFAVARGEVRPTVSGAGELRAPDESRLGRTVAEKVALVSEWLQSKRAHALLVSKLDEVAWLTNLRADEMPYQATFRALAAVTREGIYVSVHASRVTDAVRAARPGVRFTDDAGVFAAIRDAANGAEPRVALDPASVTVALRDAVAAMPADVLATTSPVVAAKAKKTPAEMAAMRDAFARADAVVARAQAWLRERVAAGEPVTELGFAAKVEALFREAGAVGLSFRVISAFGVNGAVVHHPSGDTVLTPGELVLLDTGAYFDEGFATDLTRTFFAGGPGQRPTDAQRRMFTLTLKSAIAGMTARVPAGAVGSQLDGITRAPLWREGLDYAHGTGHGVGINVHESPPGVAKTSTMNLEEGQVFSIEPGVYLEGVGGVRIENLCTVTAEGEPAGFVRVEPLTFSPLDESLIDDAMLNDAERAFMAAYRERGARRFASVTHNLALE